MTNTRLEIIALLGRRDSPTDGVEDYCTYLSKALARKGVRMEMVRVAWAEMGWPRALKWLWRESAAWQGKWVLVQYTALSWSRRGFPVGLLLIFHIIKHRGCRLGIVYHDAAGFSGHRLIDKARGNAQRWIMRQGYLRADRTISPVPTEALPWLSLPAEKMVVIPVGANIPEMVNRRRSTGEEKVVAVFGVTEGHNIAREVEDISFALRYAARQLRSQGKNIRLVVLGRGSHEAQEALRVALRGSNIPLSVLGLLPAEEVSRTLSQADVLLFVRGPISGRRGSAIAGIACGLPIVAYQGRETGFPITAAGVKLVPPGDRKALATSLARVLADEALWHDLRQRSIEAQNRYFSWDVIASHLVRTLGHE